MGFWPDPRYTKSCFVHDHESVWWGGRRCRYCTGSAGCLAQDGSPASAYLKHLFAWRVGVRGPAAVTSTYKVLGETPSARVGGPALLLLRVSFRGVLSPISDALLTSRAARLPLSVTLVVLRVVSTAGRAPSPGETPITIPLSSILASLDCNASWTGDIRRFSSLETVGQISKARLWCRNAHFSNGW